MTGPRRRLTVVALLTAVAAMGGCQPNDVERDYRVPNRIDCGAVDVACGPDRERAAAAQAAS